MTTEKVIDYLLCEKQTLDGYTSAKSLSIMCNVSERSLRLLIEEIRTNDLAKGYVLISGNSGYKLSKDSDEINQFLNRYLSAAFTQIKVAKSAKQFLNQSQLTGIQTQLEL